MPQGSNEPSVLDGVCTVSNSNASGSCEDMESSCRAADGEEPEGRERKSRRLDGLSTSPAEPGERGEPIRSMGSMPEVSNQAVVHAPQQEAGQGEEQGHDLRGDHDLPADHGQGHEAEDQGAGSEGSGSIVSGCKSGSEHHGCRPQNLESTLIASNRELLAGMTSVLSQAMTPILSGQQTLLELTQQSMSSQMATMQTVSQGQAQMVLVEAMERVAQTTRMRNDEEAWDQVHGDL